MKVLNLQCGARHLFEGWFASEPDFQSQLARGLVTCPVCADSHVQKMLSAPRLNLSGATAPPQRDGLVDNLATASASSTPQALASKGDVAETDTGSVHDADNSKPAQAAFLTAVRYLLKSTEDVGDGFAREARRMHEGETPLRSIRGQASPREATALREDGIDVMSFALPAALKETLQ